jgi:Leucine-rich repeat (LRR) protein
MKKILLITLCFTITNFIYAQNTTSIPDVKFEEYLIQANIDSDGEVNGKVLKSDINSIEALYLTNYEGIKDLSGIGGFSSLKILSLQYNYIANVDLSNNANLEELTISDTQTSTVNISQNLNLKTFEFYDEFESLNSLDLTQNVNLTSLIVTDTKLTTIDVSKNINLTEIKFHRNQLTALDVSHNTKIVELELPENQLTNLDTSNLGVLEELLISNNKITQIDLSNNLKLLDFGGYRNKLATLDFTYNTKLKYARCYNNELTSVNIKNGNNTIISVFSTENNPNLSCIKVDDKSYSDNHSGWKKDDSTRFSLECNVQTYIADSNFEDYLEFKGLGNGENNDNSVDSANISGLKVLDISDENITDLTGIEDFTSLTTLDASLNSITNVDLSKNINLETLNIAQNPTTTLNISQNIKLTSLNVSGNQLTTFDVSKNTELKVLDVKLNQLTTIDLSKNIAITELNIGSNNLASLDLSKNINLERLDAAYSELSSIEINNNKKLYYADLSGNELENLNMYDNITLGRLRINNNKLKYLDIQNNINLVELNASNNELLGLKLQNTKNSILFNIDLRVNPNLTCVEVDDTSFSNNNWPNKDTQTIYSLDCLPVNDDCDKALPLTFGQQTPGDVKNGNATNNAPCVVGTVLADVWFSVFVPQSGEFSIEGSGFGGQLKFAVYESCASLAPVACGANISLKGLTAGKKFYLKVWLETASSTSAKNQSENGTFVLKAEATSVLSLGDFINEENKISVYPNPATSNVTISSDFLIQKVELFNLFGKRIVFDRPNKSNSVVDVSGLSTGVYIVKIRSNNLSILKKLIVN